MGRRLWLARFPLEILVEIKTTPFPSPQNSKALCLHYCNNNEIKKLDTLLIFDWQVSLAYTITFLCILLLQYIFKLIPCSELSFRSPNLGPHHYVTVKM